MKTRPQRTPATTGTSPKGGRPIRRAWCLCAALLLCLIAVQAQAGGWAVQPTIILPGTHYDYYLSEVSDDLIDPGSGYGELFFRCLQGFGAEEKVSEDYQLFLSAAWLRGPDGRPYRMQQASSDNSTYFYIGFELPKGLSIFDCTLRFESDKAEGSYPLADVYVPPEQQAAIQKPDKAQAAALATYAPQATDFSAAMENLPTPVPATETPAADPHASDENAYKLRAALEDFLWRQGEDFIAPLDPWMRAMAASDVTDVTWPAEFIAADGGPLTVHFRFSSFDPTVTGGQADASAYLKAASEHANAATAEAAVPLQVTAYGETGPFDISWAEGGEEAYAAAFKQASGTTRDAFRSQGLMGALAEVVAPAPLPAGKEARLAKGEFSPAFTQFVAASGVDTTPLTAACAMLTLTAPEMYLEEGPEAVSFFYQAPGDLYEFFDPVVEAAAAGLTAEEAATLTAQQLEALLDKAMCARVLDYRSVGGLETYSIRAADFGSPFAMDALAPSEDLTGYLDIFAQARKDALSRLHDRVQETGAPMDYWKEFCTELTDTVNGELETLGAETDDGMQRAICAGGVSGLTVDTAYDPRTLKPVKATFFLRSLNPLGGSLPAYGQDPFTYWPQLVAAIGEYDVKVMVTAQYGENGFGLSDKDRSTLRSAVGKAATAARKGLNDPDVEAALLDLVLPLPMPVSAKTKAIDEAAFTPLFMRFAEGEPSGYAPRAIACAALSLKNVGVGFDGGFTLTADTPEDLDALMRQATTLAMQAIRQLADPRACTEEQAEGFLLDGLAQAVLAYRSDKNAASIATSFTLPLDSLNTPENWYAASDGYRTEFMDAFGAASESVMTQITQLPDYPPVDEPKTGRLTGSRGGTQVVLRIPDDGLARYVEFRTADDEKALTCYIRAGEKTTVHLPQGQYYLMIGEGDVWYGPEHLFGEGAGYSRTEYCDVPSNSYIYTLTLQPRSDIEDGIPIHDVDLGDLVGGA